MHALLVVEPDESRRGHFIRVALLSAGVTVGDPTNLEGAVEAAAERCVDLVVIATTAPAEMSSALRPIVAVLAGLPVVVMSPRASLTDVAEALAAGVSGFLLDSMGSVALTGALARAAAGETVLPRAVVNVVAEQMRSAVDPGLIVNDSPLTRRERQVLTMLREGMSTRAIAERLAVEPVTVRTHIASIVHKLGLRDRAEAARAPMSSSA